MKGDELSIEMAVKSVDDIASSSPLGSMVRPRRDLGRRGTLAHLGIMAMDTEDEHDESAGNNGV